jgi:hypothetical protein
MLPLEPIFPDEPPMPRLLSHRRARQRVERDTPDGDNTLSQGATTLHPIRSQVVLPCSSTVQR